MQLEVDELVSDLDVDVPMAECLAADIAALGAATNHLHGQLPEEGTALGASDELTKDLCTNLANFTDEGGSLSLERRPDSQTLSSRQPLDSSEPVG